MIVCAHGNVTEYCEEHGLMICDTWSGNLREYRGSCRVLVTDSEMSEQEYYFLKGELLAKGYELLSTRYKDNEGLLEFIVYANQRRKDGSGGRRKFEDRVVIDRILELRAAGKTLRAIREDEGVRHLNGNKLSICTISKIIEREKESEKER